MYWIEQLVNGLYQGSIYALIVIGYTLMCGIVGLPSFAYGDIVMWGAYFSYLVLTSLSTNLFVAVICCLLGASLLGLLMHYLCYVPFENSQWHIKLMCTIGFSILIRNIAQILTDSITLPMPQIFDNNYIEIFGLHFTTTHQVVLAVVIVLTTAFTLVIRKTRLGIEFKAVSQDKKAASLVGINVTRVSILGTMIGCGMGGVAGMLYAVYYSTFRATMGSAIGMKAFSAAVMGGMSDIANSGICAFIIGILENIGIAFTSTNYRDMIAFLFLIIVLMVKSSGLSQIVRRKEV